ncbi:MAG: hypothetical protein IJ679_08440 [Lachnospiraceae bacterium]|nr:hypothetical protein [Lachnospiraceae bacterium]
MIKLMCVSLLCGFVAAFFFILYVLALYRRDQEADRIKKKKELMRQERVAKLKVMLDKIEHPENYPEENEEGEEGEGEEGEEGQKEEEIEKGKVA